ncbi:uncharacterized protein LOC127789624 isoform X2 [Diospyros lotus]|uniref:uncharacterized protein LOC127789624 isoform X2 n=1 Tax=Diospyros lotus TaxID=55363 RepID=UPI00224F7FBC|nr:uncharacterized protein LOC127789624 isoform X2 [Diospyros lotus]
MHLLPRGHAEEFQVPWKAKVLEASKEEELTGARLFVVALRYGRVFLVLCSWKVSANKTNWAVPIFQHCFSHKQDAKEKGHHFAASWHLPQVLELHHE